MSQFLGHIVSLHRDPFLFSSQCFSEHLPARERMPAYHPTGKRLIMELRINSPDFSLSEANCFVKELKSEAMLISTGLWVTEPTGPSNIGARPSDVVLLGAWEAWPCMHQGSWSPAGGRPVMAATILAPGPSRRSKESCLHSFRASKKWMTNPERMLHVDKSPHPKT